MSLNSQKISSNTKVHEGIKKIDTIKPNSHKICFEVDSFKSLKEIYIPEQNISQLNFS